MSNDLNLSELTKKELEDLGGKINSINFKDRGTIEYLNDIVAKDTNNKIHDIFTSQTINPSTRTVFLHTLYLNAKWALEMKQNNMSFKDINGKTEKVKSFVTYKKSLKVLQENGITYFSLPFKDDYEIVFRYSPHSLQDLTEEEFQNFSLNGKNADVKRVTVPSVSFEKQMDLKSLFSSQLEQTLNEPLATTLSDQKLEVDDFIQKIFFQMDHEGVEAAAVTTITLRLTSCARIVDNPSLIIDLNSPFSFTIVKNINGNRIPLFSGQVLDTSIMKKA